VPELMFFEDEKETLRPPRQVEITEAHVRPLPDGRRIVVQVTLTPFVEPPSFDVTILRPDGAVERTLSVIGATKRTNAVTMHLSQPGLADEYTARVELFHEGIVLQAREVHFAASGEAATADRTLNSTL
jgi:hypothetical protein